jgi:hypothetical protein
MKTILRPSGENSFVRDALRDLFVVVVGILVALWLEAWWQDQQNRREERQVLSNLRAEFLVNGADLADVQSRLQEAIAATNDFMALINDPADGRIQVDFSSYRRIAGIRFFDPRHGQLTSVINSGKLSLVSNDELRALIADWPALATDMDLERTVFVEIMASGMGMTFREYVGDPNSKFETDIESLMSSRRFYNDLGMHLTILTIMARESETIMKSTDRIIELIDLQLGEG